MTEWITRALVVACDAIGIVFAWQQCDDAWTPRASGTAWMAALALVGVVAAVATLVAKRDGFSAASAMAS